MPKRILIIEDNADLARLLAMHLGDLLTVWGVGYKFAEKGPEEGH